MTISRRVAGLLVIQLLLWSYVLHAQMLDPSFTPPSVCLNAPVYVMYQMGDGARVGANGFSMVDGRPAPDLWRSLPSGQADAVFNANVAAQRLPAQGQVRAMVEAADRKLLLLLESSLIQLNADGTLDTGFQVGTVSGLLSTILRQTDGKILLGGNFTEYGGQPAQRVVRLLPTGALDPSFKAEVGASGRYSSELVSTLALQADGKILVGGTFETVQSQSRRALARLLPTGALDASFAPATTVATVISTVAVQPDGNILVAAYNGTQAVAASFQSVVRLTPAGQLDATFRVASGLTPVSLRPQPMLVVQPDGRILMGVEQQNHFPGQGYVLRLLANGTLDATWRAPYFGDTNGPTSMQLLPNGQVLTSNMGVRLRSASGPSSSVGLLNTDGSYNNTFAPKFQIPGLVKTVVAQPDGKLIVSGSFTEINGEEVQHLARIHANGALDLPFSQNCKLGGPSYFPVQTKVVLQPDGKVLLGGSFETVGGQAQVALARLLPSGQLDASFAADLTRGAVVDCLGLQASGSVVAAGSYLIPSNPQAATLARFRPSGQLDPTFVAPVGWWLIRDLVVQPDDRIVLAGYLPAAINSTANNALRRLLPDGASDNSFAVTGLGPAPGVYLTHVRRNATGNLMLGGMFTDIQGHATKTVARLQANGAVDGAFTSTLPVNEVTGISTQPDGRTLVHYKTASTVHHSVRLLPDGSVDRQFAAIQADGSVQQSTTLPTGAVVLVGDFTVIGGEPAGGIVRILGSSTLAAKSKQARNSTTVWPVPAQDVLHISLDMTARPQAIYLQTLTGKIVASYSATQQQLTLPLPVVPVGMYTLRVEYASGPVTQCITIQ